MNILLISKNINLIKKVLRQDYYFSTRLTYATKKIRKIWMNMIGTTYNTSKEMIDKLQTVKGKTKLKFNRNICTYYDEMNYRRQSNTFQFEDVFSTNAYGICKTYHEVFF